MERFQLANLILLFVAVAAHGQDFDGNKEVGFYLYTRQNPNNGVKIELGDSTALQQAGFNSKLPTKFITHGFVADYTTDQVQLIKNAYLQVGEYNVFGVDWQHLASDWDLAISNNHNIGKYIGRFILFLVEKHSTQLSDVHVIGHSLGGELVGFVGDVIVNPKVGRITGLDPAQQDYIDKPKEDRLDKEDAVLVDVFHTSTVGLQFPIGHVDFFPDGGVNQTGCDGDAGCAHATSWRYFADSIINPSKYVGTTCQNLQEAVSGTCRGASVQMGGFLPAGTSGIFYENMQQSKRRPTGA